MATKSRQFKPQRSFVNGVDNSTPLESPEISNTLSECLNGEMVDSDIVKTRNGYSQVTATKANTIIRSGIEYIKSDGTKENIVYYESTTLTGTSGALARVVGTALVDITTGLPDGIKPCMVQARALLFVFTGIEDFIYDGTVTRQIGIDAPTVAPQINNIISGDLNPVSRFVYVYTYYNSVTGAESSPSLPSTNIVSGGSAATDTAAEVRKGIRIQVTPGTSSSADTIRVYRTVAGGGVFFLDGTTTIDATTYDSIIGDAGLGHELELDNERLPGPAKYAVVVDNRLFVAGFSDNPNRVHYSKVGLSGAMYESFQASDFTDCNINDGDIIVGLGKVSSKVGVLKTRKVGRLITLESTSGGLERGGYQKYLYREIPSIITSTSHHGIFSVKDYMGWIGKDNVYLTDGFDIIPVANRIRKTLRELNHSQSHKYSSIMISKNQQIILSVVSTGKTEPDYQLVGHLSNFPQVGWTMFSPGVDPSTHPGIPMSCIWTVSLNNREEAYFGSSSTNGKIYQFDSGSNDDSKPIYFSIKTQWETGINAMSIKSFHKISYIATCNASSTTNILTNTWEENGKETPVKTDYSTIITPTKWGTEKWGTFKWTGLEYSIATFFPNRKSYIGRMGILNDDLNAQFAIKSMSTMYRIITE